MRILILENHIRSPAGALMSRIDARRWQAETIRPLDGGDAFPDDLSVYDGVVALGGLQDAWDDGRNPGFAAETEFLRQCDALGIPVLGICLGAQLMARAFGALVHPMADGPERGFISMWPVSGSAVAQRILPEDTDEIALISWHQDMFQLPKGAELFLSSQACANQGFFVGNCSYGFQCHIEATPEMVRDWIGDSQKWQERLQHDLQYNFVDVMMTGTAILDRWLDFVVTQKASR